MLLFAPYFNLYKISKYAHQNNKIETSIETTNRGMWVLRYSVVDGGEAENHSHWLQPSKIYALGRAEKSNFHFNSTKISKNHLELQVLQNDEDSNEPSELRITLLGASAVIGEEKINKKQLPEDQRELPIVRDISKSTQVVLGRGIKTLQFSRIPWSFKINDSLGLDLNALKQLDIEFTQKFTKYTTHLVSAELNISTTTLTALVSGIPIVTPKLLHDLIDAKSALQLNYDSNIPSVENYLISPETAARNERSSLFSNIIFVFADASQRSSIGKILETASAQVEFCHLSEDSTKLEFIAFVESLPSKGKEVVLVQLLSQETNFLESVKDPQSRNHHIHSLMSESAKELGKYLVTSEDIFNSVKDMKTDILLRKRIAKTSPPISDASVEPPAKKQKLGRRLKKVKALDSLDFFAGGGKYEPSQSQTQQQLQPSTQVQETPTTQISETPEVQATPDSLPDQPKKKKQRIKIQPLENQMLDTNYQMTPIPENSDNSAETQISQTIEKSPPVNELQAQQTQENVSKPEVSKQAEGSRDPQLKPSKQKSFHTAVLDAKRTATERINTQFGHDGTDTMDTVEQLKDLAIVEVVDIPLRSRPTLQNDSNVERNPKWVGRKNFKTFVKNSKKKVSDQSFLFTREFVPMAEYDPKTQDIRYKKDVEFLQGINGNSHKGQQAIEVQDLDEDQETDTFAFRNDTLRQPTLVDNPNVQQTTTKNNLFVASDEEDEDDGLNMGIRRDYITDVPEFRRHIDQEPNEIEKQTNAITKPQAIPIEESDDNMEQDESDDDDDDDDETPKFKFRR